MSEEKRDNSQYTNSMYAYLNTVSVHAICVLSTNMNKFIELCNIPLSFVDREYRLEFK